MKNFSKIVLIFGLLTISVIQAQSIDEWKKMDPKQRKALINKMSPEERVELLDTFRQNMLVDELGIPEDKKVEFKNLYSEYQESQRNIKKQFHRKLDYQNMSEEDAQQELKNSFDIGQQLLDNRRKYSEKFQKIMSPQQVLKMFETEGRMRNKVMDRDRQMKERGASTKGL